MLVPKGLIKTVFTLAHTLPWSGHLGRDKTTDRISSWFYWPGIHGDIMKLCFSPFELLYGRQPRGILDLLKESWEEEPSPSKNTLRYVIDIRNRLDMIGQFAKENLKSAQERQERQYNQNARLRVFQPGDQVMLLLPTSESKLLAKWQDPFQVLRRTGEVNYEISQPGSRKGKQIYHVNLLKPWKTMSSLFIHPREGETDLGPKLPKGSTYTDHQVPMGEQLTTEQRSDLLDVCDQFPDVFSELPGQTDLVSHRIETEPGVKVLSCPYRLPEGRKDLVEREIIDMLELGVIEESHSEWCSPIVLDLNQIGR
ncbi:hypothetical protein FKM82_027996 [Ascaphus truei]